jgi:GT2 family glycosyltransferase
MANSERVPLVCIIILDYNGREHLEYSLPSIAATEYQSLKIIVVDNGSSLDSANYIREHHPEIILLTSPSNLGWSGGNNFGIKYARRLGADYVILANNDIKVDKRWAKVAVQVAQRDRRIGIVCFRILEPEGLEKDDSGFEQAVAEWTEVQISESNYVTGMAMFVPMPVFEQIGLIDEGFFAYAEDNDFERRVKKAGYRMVAINVPVWHLGQASFGRRPLWAATLQIRNNLRLSLKHDPPRGILYQFSRHFAKGCLPFLRLDPHDRIARRLRPSNIFVNLGILLYAVVWNLWHLPETFKSRREGERRVHAARR